MALSEAKNTSSPVSSPRVLVAGIFHETHCFLEQPTVVGDFEITRGREMFDISGDASPLGGALEAMQEMEWDILPSADYRAIPSGVVEDAVVEGFWHDVQSIWDTRVNAVFLVLHGAMVSKSFADVEGELLMRLRRLQGASSVPVFGVYDLHANFSPEMATHADGLIAYRTNPHVDARQAAVRAVGLLRRCLEANVRPRMVSIPLGHILAPLQTGTEDQPMRSLEALARKIESDEEDCWAVNVSAGFAYGDTPNTGISVQLVTVGSVDSVTDIEERFRRVLAGVSVGENSSLVSVEEAKRLLGDEEDGVTVLVEPSDNIGAGAPGDGTGALRLLMDMGIGNAAVALYDPLAVERLREFDVEDRVRLSLGGKGSRFDLGPVIVEVQLIRFGSGRFRLEDERSHLASISGSFFDMGTCAVVQFRGILILLTSVRTPPFDLGQWRSQGIEPSELRVVVVKAAVAHRCAYDGIAKRSIVVETPGPCSSDLTLFPYKSLVQ
jgi:microcystin degradation protein MlrC